MSAVELCLKLLEELNAHERAQVARKINHLNKEALMTSSERSCAQDCSELCDLVFNNTGISVNTKARDTMVVNARRYICRKMRDKGYSLTAIGKALNLNHSSVYFHCKMAQDAEDYAFMYPEYHYIKNKVEADASD